MLKLYNIYSNNNKNNQFTNLHLLLNLSNLINKHKNFLKFYCKAIQK